MTIFYAPPNLGNLANLWSITVPKSHPIMAEFDRIEMLHRRLHAFMGDVWAEQLIIALNNIAKTSAQSYQELLEQAAEVVVALAKEGTCNLSIKPSQTI